MQGGKSRTRATTALVRAGAGAVGLLLASCNTEETPSILLPAGPGAERIAGLWWLMLWIATVVFVVVTAMFVYAVVRSRRREDAREPAPWGDKFIAIFGLILPFVILFAVYLISLRDMNWLASAQGEPDLVIEITGNDWWWEATYPNGAVTANEIHIPAGEPVQFELNTNDVIHSFWVPRLQAKMDLIPGRTNYLWLEADEPGRYRGECAEFCGFQHANMGFYVVADPPEVFQQWMAQQANPAPEPDTPLEEHGKEVFLSSTCVSCHAIRGTEADAQIGPDLTHMDERETLAGGTFPNTAELLTKWIIDPQELKPGVTMPPTQLSREDLAALVAYLESLDLQGVDIDRTD